MAPKSKAQRKKSKTRDSKGKKGKEAAPAENPVAKLVTRLEETNLPWFEALDPLPKTTKTQISSEKAQEYWNRAKELFDNEMDSQAKRKRQLSSDDKYLLTMMKSGTLADRVASMTLSIQSNPLRNLHRLSQMITMSKKKARRESQLAIESLKDLFINTLLPDRKLSFFHAQPLTEGVSPEFLFMWYFEHCVKTAYAELVAALETGMRDAVENHKRACINATFELLSAKSEQENTLLTMLVNKLGDPERKVASKAMVLLQDLLNVHPAMKKVVASEVERLLSRSNATERTQYHAVLFLNQIYLSESESDTALAAHLISVYFSLFTKAIHAQRVQAPVPTKTKTRKRNGKVSKSSTPVSPPDNSTMGRKLLSALLTGVNRAYPYAKCTASDFQKEIDDLFRVVHQMHFATSVQALMLLFQVMNSTNSVSDRFYTALYTKLHDPQIRTTSKHTLFLNLIYRALKADVSPARSQAILKRLLQLAMWMPPTFSCAVLFLTSEVMEANPLLKSIILQPEETGASQTEDGNEHFADVDTGDDNESTQPAEVAKSNEDEFKIPDGEEARSQAILDSILSDEEDVKEAEEPEKSVVKPAERKVNAVYDASKRNPLYAGAEAACAWELSQLLHHYHPSVQVFANQLIKGKIQYSGDPLTDFSLTSFFEKFINKKAKRKDMPTRKGHAHISKSMEKSVALDSEKFLNLDEEQVDVSDRFFHKFFKEQAKRRPRSKSSKEDEDAIAKDLAVDEEDQEMEAYAQSLAEGLMQDNFDDDDEFGGDLSDSETEEPQGDFGEGNLDEFDEDDEDDEDEMAAMAEMINQMDGDDLDDDEGFDFEGGEESPIEGAPKDSKSKKNGQRKSPFASADDYLEMIEAAAQNESEEPENGSRSVKRSRTISKAKSKNKKRRKN